MTSEKGKSQVKETNNDAKDENKCQLCSKLFKKPKLTPCYHTFCLECLENYVQKFSRVGHFKCPTCKGDITIPKGGVKTFQTNFYVDQIHNKTTPNKPQVPCDICGPYKPAETFCLDCDENICAACTASHMKMKITSDHLLAELAPYDNTAFLTRKSRAPLYCTYHSGEEITIVCKQCKHVLCKLCNTDDHRNHAVKGFFDEAGKAKLKLKTMVENSYIKTNLKSQKDYVEKIKSELVNLPKRMKKDIRKVEMHVKKLHAMLEAEKKNIEKQIRDEYFMKTSQMQNELVECQKKYDHNRSLLTGAKELLDSGDDQDYIHRGSSLYDSLAILNMEAPAADKKVIGGVRFEPANVTSEMIFALIGRIKDPFLEKVEQEEENEAGPQFQVRVARARVGVVHIFSKEVGTVMTTAVSGIAPMGNGRAWIASSGYPYIRLVDVNGTMLEIVNIGCNVDDLTKTNLGGCLVTCSGKKCIKYVNHQLEVSDFISHTFQHPHGIFSRVGLEGEEIVVSFSDFTSKGTPGYGNGYIDVFNAKGDLIKNTISRHQQPIRIDTDRPSGDYCVADLSAGTITVHEEDGKVKSLYGKQTFDTFTPYGICFDNQCGIIVVDQEQNRIIRLSRNGAFLQTLIEGNNMRGITSVAFDEDNYLWIGSEGMVHVYRLVVH
ncbi:hypothetical protein ACJMK2_015808 [Sinanodonta woodiana]|uniref:Uncharacterized protein n=1 Tax=Sinanodonta woodiana TaxID=1069815 RepID=A0ABD3URT9_SINWO